MEKKFVKGLTVTKIGKWDQVDTALGLATSTNNQHKMHAIYRIALLVVAVAILCLNRYWAI